MSILAVNYAGRLGEIDIIGTEGGCIFFAEVKTRGPNALFSPAEAVDLAKQRKIAATAAQYLRDNPRGLQPRFDIIEVCLDGSAAQGVNHIRNAFDSPLRNGY